MDNHAAWWQYALLPVVVIGLAFTALTGGEDELNATHPSLSPVDRAVNIVPLFIGSSAAGGIAGALGKEFLREAPIASSMILGSAFGSSQSVSGLIIHDIRRGEASSLSDYTLAHVGGGIVGALISGTLESTVQGASTGLKLVSRGFGKILPETAGGIPHFEIGEIKNIVSYREALHQIAERETSGNTALALYDNAGNVHIQVFSPNGKGGYQLFWEGYIGRVGQLPAHSAGTAPFGNEMEPLVRNLIEIVTGRRFMPKESNAPGPDLVPLP